MKFQLRELKWHDWGWYLLVLAIYAFATAYAFVSRQLATLFIIVPGTVLYLMCSRPSTFRQSLYDDPDDFNRQEGE